MEEEKYTVHAKKIRRDKQLLKIAKLAIVIVILAIIFSYLVIGFIYNSGNFTITLDRNSFYERGLVIYDDPNYKTFRSELIAESIDTFDNVTELWLPADLDSHGGGSNNGENYISYTFYIENTGENATDYYSEILIEDVVKNVDEAVRIKVYKNGESITYAKASASGEPEEDTVAFTNDELVVLDETKDFQPGDVTKYTIVIWLEGKDPETTNNIIGGEINLQMKFNSEIVDK